MATAPKPGTTKKNETKRAGVRITISGNTWVLHMADLGPNDDLVARKETGLPVTPFFEEDRFGMDSLLIMYWMARRKSGENNLRYATVVEEFPTYQSVIDADILVEALESDDETEDAPDPLPSDAG